MHVYLVRHGQSYVNLPDWNDYDWDKPLTDLGERQAAAAAKWLKENVDARMLYSSTLVRTHQTADYVSEAMGLDILFDHRIREIGTNAPDGAPLKTSEETRYIEGVWGTQQPYDPVTGKGENWMQFRSRVGSFIESLIRMFSDHVPRNAEKRAEQSIIVVCHGGVIEAFFEYAFEKGPWSVISVMTHNTGISHFEYRPSRNRPAWRLHYHNRVEHLPANLKTE